MSTVFSDLDKMRRLLLTRQSCVAINTADESYALGVLKNVCMEMGLNLYLWSVTEGLRSGIVADSADIGARVLSTLVGDLTVGVAVSPANARFDLNEDGTVKPMHTWGEDLTRCIQSIKISHHGKGEDKEEITEVKFHSKGKALSDEKLEAKIVMPRLSPGGK